MKPLIVLISAFVIVLIISRVIWDSYEVNFAARVALSAMLLFTSAGHFIYTKGMIMMIPVQVPSKTAVVYVTGIIEIIAAVMLLIKQTRNMTGIFLIWLFVVMIFANINAALKKVDYEKANYEGKGLTYLWFRIPFQVLLIIWTYYSAINT